MKLRTGNDVLSGLDQSPADGKRRVFFRVHVRPGISAGIDELAAIVPVHGPASAGSSPLQGQIEGPRGDVKQAVLDPECGRSRKESLSGVESCPAPIEHEIESAALRGRFHLALGLLRQKTPPYDSSPADPPYEALCQKRILAPEEPAKGGRLEGWPRASTGPSWFSRRCEASSGDARSALLTMRGL